MKKKYVLSTLLLLVWASAARAQRLPTAVPPPLPLKIAQMIWDSCTAIDYTFNELPISLSVDNQTTIRQNVMHIAADSPPTLDGNCKPMARIFFAQKNKILLDADVYFKQECTYYLYFRHGESTPIYANKMTQTGLDFFKNVLSQVEQK